MSEDGRRRHGDRQRQYSGSPAVMSPRVSSQEFTSESRPGSCYMMNRARGPAETAEASAMVEINCPLWAEIARTIDK
jgi:hypothetical protein